MKKNKKNYYKLRSIIILLFLYITTGCQSQMNNVSFSENKDSTIVTDSDYNISVNILFDNHNIILNSTTVEDLGSDFSMLPIGTAQSFYEIGDYNEYSQYALKYKDKTIASLFYFEPASPIEKAPIQYIYFHNGFLYDDSLKELCSVNGFKIGDSLDSFINIYGEPHEIKDNPPEFRQTQYYYYNNYSLCIITNSTNNENDTPKSKTILGIFIQSPKK